MPDSRKFVGEFLIQLVPFGYLDIERAQNVLQEANIDFADFGDYVSDFLEDTQYNFFDLDICALAYDFALQQVRQEIEEITGTDILNETEVYVYGN